MAFRSETDHPNFVLINCDDLGYGDLGCYGSVRNRTPWLDRMAGQGIRFTDFYMAAPVCSASRGALLTGCYPRRIGFDVFSRAAGVLFPGDTEGLNPSERTIASLLRERGYVTRCIGKWHCGDQPPFLPTRHGFDGYFGIPYSNDMGRQKCVLFRDFPPLPLLRDEEVVEQQPDLAGLIERYVEDAILFMRQNRERPFFLYLAPFQVHLPLYAPERFLRESRNGRYGACVECVDWAVGMLLHELTRLGLERHTLVMFTSDNGSRYPGEGGSNAPLRGGKHLCWEGGLRVPFIAYWAGHLPAGMVRRDLTASIDLLPTLVRLAGGQVPDDRTIDGRPIPALVGNGAGDSREVFFYYHGDRLTAVREGPWKLFVRVPAPGHAPESHRTPWQPGFALYNLQRDIGETTDVSRDHPDVVTRLMRRIESCREDLGDGEVGAPGRDRRPCGHVEEARPLTSYDPNYPYLIAEYDLSECG